MANKAIIYAIYPNNKQNEQCQKTFGCCRFVYNQMLTVQQNRHKSGEKHLSKMSANTYCNQHLKTDYPFLKEVDKFALTNAVYHLSDGYDRFFKHLGKFPKYKNKHKAGKSYTTNFTNGNIEIGNNYIKLPKLGKVKAKIHRHIANQRKDFLHKESTAIAKQYSCVCVEDLNMKGMSNKGFGNGKATLDNGYGMFLNMLCYKLQDRGGYFIKVDKFFPSSQLCHCCGFKNSKLRDLSIRRWDCPACGTKNIDRDINAAQNIKYEGLRLLSA